MFCGLSGAVYLVNDVADVERDRLHPRKRLRPLASGALRRPVGPDPGRGHRGLVGCLVAALLGMPFLLCAAGYLVLNLAYSFRLKNVGDPGRDRHQPGFVLRAVAGAVAISVRISDWLLVCTFLLALFLALSKRRHELVTALRRGQRPSGRSWPSTRPYLLDQMIAVVTASCLMAYCFYTMAPETVEKYRTDRLSWTIPFVLYGIFRYLYLVHQKEQGGSPTDVLLTDRPLLVDVALWAVAMVVIVYSASGAPVPRGLLRS